MKLLAVSGGVDSMLMAYKYKDKNVVVAFVNYNLRNDTHIDEKIVDNFCKKYNIKLEKLILDENNNPKSNFENWARNVRYDFFKKIYKKYNCNQLILAHHKDDFLETCLMQKEKNETKLFYGIKKRLSYKEMKIFRPFLNKYWKSEIYELANKLKIDYHDDYTNLDIKYARNKIRKELSKYSNDEKNKMLTFFNDINKKNINIIKNINNEYKIWRKSSFSTNNFVEFKYKEELLKKFINLRQQNINLSKNIVKNIIDFIISKNNKSSFILTNNNYLIKKKNKLHFIKNKI